MGDTFDLTQGGTVTWSGQLADRAATVGDMLTVQADQSIAATASGGSQPVSCYLQAIGFSLATEGDHPALWTALADDPWNDNALTAIPAGLGLVFAFDGSDATLTASEAGIWALSFFANVAPNATFAGVLNDSFAARTPLVAQAPNDALLAALTAVYAIPAGASFAPSIRTTVAGAGAQGSVALVIVRFD